MVKKAKQEIEVKPIKTIEEIQAENTALRTAMDKISSVPTGDSTLARYITS